MVYFRQGSLPAEQTVQNMLGEAVAILGWSLDPK